MKKFEFISPDDNPALIAITDADWAKTVEEALHALDYKCHQVENHDEFITQYNQAQYQVVILEDTFEDGSLEENHSLHRIQEMAMPQRRHTVFFLLSSSLQTLNALQAFQQSIHVIINPAEFHSLPQIIQKSVSDNNLFLHNFRDMQMRIAQGKDGG